MNIYRLFDKFMLWRLMSRYWYWCWCCFRCSHYSLRLCTQAVHSIGIYAQWNCRSDYSPIVHSHFGSFIGFFILYLSLHLIEQSNVLLHVYRNNLWPNADRVFRCDIDKGSVFNFYLRFCCWCLLFILLLVAAIFTALISIGIRPSKVYFHHIQYAS